MSALADAKGENGSQLQQNKLDYVVLQGYLGQIFKRSLARDFHKHLARIMYDQRCYQIIYANFKPAIRNIAPRKRPISGEIKNPFNK